MISWTQANVRKNRAVTLISLVPEGEKKRPHLSLLAWCPSHITSVRTLLRVHGKSQLQLAAASSDGQPERDQVIPRTFPVVRD